MSAANEYGIDDSTIEGQMLAGMVNRGLSLEQSQEVMDAYKESEAGQTMTGRLNESPDAYPPMMMNVIWMGVQAQAVDWIEENCPQHWAKAMFSDEPTHGINPA